MVSLLHIGRWCVGAALGLISGFLLRSIVAAFLYALPRAVINAVRNSVKWKVSWFYLRGSLAYSVVLVLIAFFARWIQADTGGMFFGFVASIVASLANLKALRADVDRRLGSGAKISV